MASDNTEIRWKGIFRVYWSGEPETIWSVDDGNVENEQCVRLVLWKVTGITIYELRTGEDLTADNKVSPRGWVEGVGTVVIREGVAIILLE